MDVKNTTYHSDSKSKNVSKIVWSAFETFADTVDNCVNHALNLRGKAIDKVLSFKIKKQDKSSEL